MRNKTIQRRVREAFDDSLGPNKFGNLAKDEEVADFERKWKESGKTERCCENAVFPNFRIYLGKNVACGWNKSAALVLADHILAQDKLDPNQHYRYRQGIATHLQSLRKEYMNLPQTEEQRQMDLKNSAKNTRRQTVRPFHSRLDLSIKI